MVLIGDKNGIYGGTDASVGNLLNDDIAANRYEHMAYRAIENALFYNPKLEDDEIKLEIATRVVKVSNNKQLEAETDELGYAKRRDEKGCFDASTRIVTDAAAYKAALGIAAVNSERTSAVWNLNVQSINYANYQFRQGFLYLADTLCTVYQGAVTASSNVLEASHNLMKVCKKYIEKNNLFIWAYNAIDQRYRKLYEAYREHRYFDCLRTVNELRQTNSDLVNIYDTLWLQPLEKMIIEHAAIVDIHFALQQLEVYLQTPKFNLLIADRILNVLKECTDKWESKDGLRFLLHKNLIIVSNHKGNHEEAKQHYEKCMEFAQYANVEEYLELMNMHSVACLDSGEIPEAMEVAKAACSYNTMLKEIKSDIYPESAKNSIHVHYGRAISQYAQCLAFDGQYDKALDQFDIALSMFGTSAEDRARTMSYAMHTAIEKHDQITYEKYAKDYFGTVTIKKQLSKLKKTESASVRFALYVYVKALYVFYKGILDAEYVSRLSENLIEMYQKNRDGHPWEMIFKYCALLYRYYSNDTPAAKNAADELMRIANESVAGQYGILEQILEEGNRQYENAKQGNFDLDSTGKLKFMYR